MNPKHTPFHPRWHRKRMPIFWWLEKWSSARFILRELTSVFVALAAVQLLVQVAVLARGGAAWEAFGAWLRSPAGLAANGLILLALLYHALTWFHLAPKAMALYMKGQRVPGGVILASNYIAWIAASGLIGWWLLRGGT